MDNTELTRFILLEEADDNEVMFLWYLEQEKRNDHDPLFSFRSTEGYYEILINGHLRNNENKFREFFRLNRR